MDAATTTLPPPSSSSGSVSLRPGGGGGRFSFRPNSGSAVGSASNESFSGLAGSRTSSFTSSFPTFPHRQEKRASKSRSELTRYSKEELLRLKNQWTTVPAEISGSDVQRTSTAFLEDPGRREPSYIPERSIEPDTRDWRGRTPIPAPQPEQERVDRQNQYRERPIPVKEGRGPGDRQQVPPIQGRLSEQSSVSGNLQQQQQQQQPGPPPAIVKAANPWSARRGTQSEKEKVLKTVKGILNKLTPEKYDTLVEQLKQSGITSSEILQGVISLVFDKAVLEPTFCAMYSSLCVDLSKKLPEFPPSNPNDPKDKPVTFRRVLLNTCQAEFEGADALRAEIRQLTSPEQEQVRQEKERSVKLRTLGNIKFIGELFKQKMIPEKIVHACIQELLGMDPKVVPAEENVEALCQLFSTVGKALDASPKSKNAIDVYFARLKDFANKPALPSRIRFMVRDVLDSRGNDWVPRREEVKAKTISEVHAEAEQKLGLRAGSASLKIGRAGAPPAGIHPGATMMPGAPGAPGSGRGGAMMPGAPVIAPGSGFVGGGGQPPYFSGLEGEGWETVSQARGMKSRREPLASAPQGTSAYNRLPLAGMRGSRTLPGSGGSFQGKSSALLGSSTPTVQAPPTTLRNGPAPPDMGPRAAPNVPVAEVPTKFVDSYVEVPSSTPPTTRSSSIQVKKATESLLEEYFSIQNLEEALRCVKDLGSSQVHPQFVEVVVGVVFEKFDKEQELASRLFEYLYAEHVLSGEAIRSGFLASSEQLEEVDAPFAPKFLGRMLGNLLFGKVVNTRLLVDIAKKIEDDFKSRDVLVFTFQTLLVRTGEGSTVAAFRTLSAEDLNLFGSKGDLIESLTKGGLEVLATYL